MATYVSNILACGSGPDNVLYLELNEASKQVSGSSAPHTAAHQSLGPDLKTPDSPLALLHVCPLSVTIYKFSVYNQSISDKHYNLIG